MGAPLTVAGGYRESPTLFVQNAFRAFRQFFKDALMECENGAVYFAMVETEVMLPCSEGSELCESYINNYGWFLFLYGESL